MEKFKLDILRAIAERSTPYCNIQDMETEYDIRSQNFTSSFLQLESEGAISSNSHSCGLHIAHGNPSWSVVDLYVTEYGKSLITPPKQPRGMLLIKITEHPIVSALAVAAIIAGFSYYVWPSLGSDQELLQQQIQLPSNTNEYQSK